MESRRATWGRRRSRLTSPRSTPATAAWCARRACRSSDPIAWNGSAARSAPCCNVRKRPDKAGRCAHNALVILDSRICYRALKARDARFDGRFFVAVSSTRVYCRPVCTVKPPKRENCRFYPSAAAAETGGYRPCLRCRPELAPGNSSIDATTRLAQAAASLIEDGTMNGAGVEALAGRLGVSERHVRRALDAEFGVSPVAFAQTQRLL